MCHHFRRKDDLLFNFWWTSCWHRADCASRSAELFGSPDFSPSKDKLSPHPRLASTAVGAIRAFVSGSSAIRQWNWLSAVRMWARGRSRLSASYSHNHHSVTFTCLNKKRSEITVSDINCDFDNLCVIAVGCLSFWKTRCFLMAAQFRRRKPRNGSRWFSLKKCCCGGQTCLSTCTDRYYNTHTHRRCQNYPTCSFCVLRIQ